MALRERERAFGEALVKLCRGQRTPVGRRIGSANTKEHVYIASTWNEIS
jgi:hypothetical protein